MAAAMASGIIRTSTIREEAGVPRKCVGSTFVLDLPREQVKRVSGRGATSRKLNLLRYFRESERKRVARRGIRGQVLDLTLLGMARCKTPQYRKSSAFY